MTWHYYGSHYCQSLDSCPNLTLSNITCRLHLTFAGGDHCSVRCWHSGLAGSMIFKTSFLGLAGLWCFQVSFLFSFLFSDIFASLSLQVDSNSFFFCVSWHKFPMDFLMAQIPFDYTNSIVSSFCTFLVMMGTCWRIPICLWACWSSGLFVTKPSIHGQTPIHGVKYFTKVLHNGGTLYWVALR